MLMRAIYSVLSYLLIPFVLMRLWWRGRRLPAYRKRWFERFGFFRTPHLNKPIWVHAVSFGEAAAAEGLICNLKQRYPDRDIVVTALTPTGSERIVKNFGDSVFHVYFPYDNPNSVKRFLKKIKPTLLIIMETELWPNLLHYCAKRNTPVLLANARLSAESMRGYQRIHWLTKPMLQALTMVAAQSEIDAQHFRALGLPKEKLMITGSVKFDIDLPTDVIHQGRSLRYSWDGDRPVWIAASTHNQEETQILQVFAKVRESIPDLLLMLVPRHPDRFQDVYDLSKKQGWNVIKRSEGRPARSDTDILLGDTMGELVLFYAAADVAFVGGSLVPIGGHNLLEPAAVGLPILTGPHLRNFYHISKLLDTAGALFIGNTVSDLSNTLLQLFQNNEKREQAKQAGQDVIQENRGALEKHLTWVDDYLLKESSKPKPSLYASV